MPVSASKTRNLHTNVDKDKIQKSELWKSDGVLSCFPCLISSRSHMLTDTASSHKRDSWISLRSCWCSRLPKTIWMLSAPTASPELSGLTPVPGLDRSAAQPFELRSAEAERDIKGSQDLRALTMNRPGLNRNNSDMCCTSQSAHDVCSLNGAAASALIDPAGERYRIASSSCSAGLHHLCWGSSSGN